MELRVESTEGYSLPSGCHVGVRVGDVLKQGRYEPQRCYHFPQVDRRRNAKIDLYQHVGSCVVTVDPATKSNHEVAVTTTDPSFPATKLKVSVQSKSEEAGKQHREERTKTLKNQAKDYLAKHCVEERLSEAVKALLKEQPADPTEFLCRFFREDQSHLLKPAETPQNQKTQAATAAAKPQEVAPAAPPAATKSSAPVRKPAPAKPTVAAEQVPESTISSKQKDNSAAKPKDLDSIRAKASEVLTQATDNGELERALLAAKQDMETNQEARFDRPLEEERSTHLMHNMAMCGPAFSSFGMQPGLVFI
mmetsp:Transcript_51670/g.92798  ORF Transcript_51670/g.92798 Transcript_51670/m.92798 type:complete len:307 (-) Transcript_51670:254-1174(-)